MIFHIKYKLLSKISRIVIRIIKSLDKSKIFKGSLSKGGEVALLGNVANVERSRFLKGSESILLLLHEALLEMLGALLKSDLLLEDEI